MEHYDIFISYRRNGGAQYARIIQLMLIQRGYKVFLDYDELSDGALGENIKEAIQEAPIYMLVLSKGSMDRCAHEGDWLREEISYAISLKKHIIPINPDNSFDGFPQEMPESLKVVIGSYPFSEVNFGSLLSVTIDIMINNRVEPLVGKRMSVGRRDEDDRCACQPSTDYKSSHMPKNTASRTSIVLKVLSAPIAIIAAPISIVASGINNAVSAIKERTRQIKQEGVSYQPACNLFDEDSVFSSIFAPAEVKRKNNLQVQVFLHPFKETDKVKTLAKESDRSAERRDYIPLQCKLKKGDTVDVQLNIYGETLLMSEKKSVVWQGSFTKCSFDYFVPKDIDVDELSCATLLTVNGIPLGEMRFVTKIVDRPRLLPPEVISHRYNKVFISYAHKDEDKVRSFHEGLKLCGIDHFFDRDYLKAGDVFPQVIQDYIDTADLFVLFWSENAAESDYVAKERAQALERAFPQIKPEKAAKLRIYPMSIEPRAELPTDMKDYYHFGEM